MTQPQRSIDDLRAEVDQINRDLLTLLSKRGEVVAQIGHAKTSEGRPNHYDPAREEKQLKELESLNPGPNTCSCHLIAGSHGHSPASGTHSQALDPGGIQGPLGQNQAPFVS